MGTPQERREARERADLRIDALGSGSDYTPFIQHLGIASLNIGFGGEDGGGVYHSIYDTPTWFERFNDPSYQYGRALAQVVGTSVMRLANADLLPYEFTNLAETIRGYLGEVKALRDDAAQRVAETNRMIDEGIFTATTDPLHPTAAPKTEPLVPALNFAPLDNAVDSLTRAAARYAKASARALGGPANPATLARANALLRGTERMFTSPEEGWPKRPMVPRHLAVRSRACTPGYGVKDPAGGARGDRAQRLGDDRSGGRAAVGGDHPGCPVTLPRSQPCWKAGG